MKDELIMVQSAAVLVSPSQSLLREALTRTSSWARTRPRSHLITYYHGEDSQALCGSLVNIKTHFNLNCDIKEQSAVCEKSRICAEDRGTEQVV